MELVGEIFAAAGNPRLRQQRADRFDLSSQIVFDTRVTAATFNEDTDSWLIETDRGDRVTAKFCIMADGRLSARTAGFAGMEDLRG